MKYTLISIYSSIIALLLVLGCTSQQIYNSGQTWQRNECKKIVDHIEYERCMSKMSTTYEDYKRQTENSKK